MKSAPIAPSTEKAQVGLSPEDALACAPNHLMPPANPPIPTHSKTP